MENTCSKVTASCSCVNHGKHSSLMQHMDEMDFSRSFHGACAEGKLDRVRTLLARNPALVHQIDSFGYAPLHYAARNGNLNIVQLLLKAGADVSLPTKGSATLPIHRACMSGNLATVNLLLQNGADPSAKDNRNLDAFYYASGNSLILDALSHLKRKD